MDKKHLTYGLIGLGAFALLYFWAKNTPATMLPQWLQPLVSSPPQPNAAGGNNNNTTNPQPGSVATGARGIPPAPSASAANPPNAITSASQGSNLVPNPN